VQKNKSIPLRLQGKNLIIYVQVHLCYSKDKTLVIIFWYISLYNTCVISGFCIELDKNWDLLGSYAVVAVITCRCFGAIYRSYFKWFNLEDKTDRLYRNVDQELLLPLRNSPEQAQFL
jgi:hypothetical protein